MPPLSVVDHSVDPAEENRNDVQPIEHGPDTVDDVDGPHEIDPEVFFFFFLAPDEDDGEKNPFVDDFDGPHEIDPVVFFFFFGTR